MSCGNRIGDVANGAQPPDPRSYTPKHLAEKILTSRSALEGERKRSSCRPGRDPHTLGGLSRETASSEIAESGDDRRVVGTWLGAAGVGVARDGGKLLGNHRFDADRVERLDQGGRDEDVIDQLASAVVAHTRKVAASAARR